MIILKIILTHTYFHERRKKCRKKVKNVAKLAWRLLSEICANLIDYLKNILSSQHFVNRHKNAPKDFTRSRKLPFQTLVLFMINFIKGSYQDELDHFFKAWLKLEVAFHFVSKMALSKARMKLKYSAFVELNQHLVEYFYVHFKHNTWCGFNLLAVDGSTLKLFKFKDIKTHFGIIKPSNGKACPMARVSQMFDVLNKMTVDAIISPYHVGERELMKQHLLKLLPNDLLLLDRGYPSYWIFNLILSLDGHFCARISNQWQIVQQFIKSGRKEAIISLKPSFVSKNESLEMGLDTSPLPLRLVRIELNSGEVEVLITSLTDSQTYPHDIFMDLYHKRWPVEEDYKIMKTRIEIGNFSGESALSVYQDFHAKVFAKNLTSVLAFPANAIVKKKNESNKHDRQINFTQAISKSKDTIILLFERSRDIVLDLITQLHAVFISATEPIRPGRKFKRNHKMHSRAFYMNNKPCR